MVEKGGNDQSNEKKRPGRKGFTEEELNAAEEVFKRGGSNEEAASTSSS